MLFESNIEQLDEWVSEVSMSDFKLHKIGYVYNKKSNSFVQPTKNVEGDDLVSYNYENAKSILTHAISEDIESSGYTWQVRNAVDLQNIKDYAGLEDDVTQSFRMADNTWQDLTVDKFEKVLSDYRLRKKDIYNSYKTWTNGDMLEEFTIKGDQDD